MFRSDANAHRGIGTCPQPYLQSLAVQVQAMDTRPRHSMPLFRLHVLTAWRS